jgi:hypothetical protein
LIQELYWRRPLVKVRRIDMRDWLIAWFIGLVLTILGGFLLYSEDIGVVITAIRNRDKERIHSLGILTGSSSYMTYLIWFVGGIYDFFWRFYFIDC